MSTVSFSPATVQPKFAGVYVDYNRMKPLTAIQTILDDKTLTLEEKDTKVAEQFKRDTSLAMTTVKVPISPERKYAMTDISLLAFLAQNGLSKAPLDILEQRRRGLPHDAAKALLQHSDTKVQDKFLEILKDDSLQMKGMIRMEPELAELFPPAFAAYEERLKKAEEERKQAEEAVKIAAQAAKMAALQPAQSK